MTDHKALIALIRDSIAEDGRSYAYVPAPDAVAALADALEAITPVVDRDALVALLVANREVVAGSARDYVDSEATADLILSSGILLDCAEVESQALERAAADIGDDRKAPRAWLRARAIEIREGRA